MTWDSVVLCTTKRRCFAPAVKAGGGTVLDVTDDVKAPVDDFVTMQVWSVAVCTLP